MTVMAGVIFFICIVLFLFVFCNDGDFRAKCCFVFLNSCRFYHSNKDVEKELAQQRLRLANGNIIDFFKERIGKRILYTDTQYGVYQHKADIDGVTLQGRVLLYDLDARTKKTIFANEIVVLDVLD